eukprot:2885406-Rhodomonas_salina.1
MTRRQLLRALVTFVEPDETAIWIQGHQSMLERLTRKRDRSPQRLDSRPGRTGLGSDDAQVRALTALLRKKGDHVTS